MSEKQGLTGGAPFAAVKNSFLDLLKKDSNASPAASPAPSPASSGSKAPAAEHDQLLLDQLSALSQSLADSQMSNTELRAQVTRLQSLHDQLVAERGVMVSKAEAQEREMARLREKVSFAALDATNEQIKALKAEAAAAQKENEELKSQNRILFENYSEINGEYKAFYDESVAKDERLTALEAELNSTRAEREEARESARVALEQLEAARAQVQQLQQQLADQAAQLESARLASLQSELSSTRERLASTESLLHASQTERNRAAARESMVRNELRRVQASLASKESEVGAAHAEQQRLREDLARKSKSLSDALAALAAGPSGPPGSQEHTVIVAAPQSSSVSGRDWGAMQSLANSLSETLLQKDEQLTVLKKQCAGLGRRVIELEALLDKRTGGSEVAAAATPANSSSSTSSSSSSATTAASSASSSTSHSTSQPNHSSPARDANGAAASSSDPENAIPSLRSYRALSVSSPLSSAEVASRSRSTSAALQHHIASLDAEPDLP